ncbi:MAG: hypothetical protein IPJ98_10935 [Bryobacterales bacterium]|nr:hypothetical protein [Bryobacterales bacterium]
MIRRQLIRWGVCLGTSWALKRGVDWYRGRDGNMALRLAEAGERAGDVEQSYPYGDGPVPVGFPSSVPLLPNRQVVATRVLPREKKTYWKLDYWAHARAQEALAYHERGFEQAGWTVEPARREGGVADLGKEGCAGGGGVCVGPGFVRGAGSAGDGGGAARALTARPGAAAGRAGPAPPRGPPTAVSAGGA